MAQQNDHSTTMKAKASRCKSCHKPWAACLCKHALTHENLLSHVSAQEREQVTFQMQARSTGTTRATVILSETDETTVSKQPTVPCTATAWRSRPENVCSHKYNCQGKSENYHSHKLVHAIVLSGKLRPNCSWKRQWRHRVNTINNLNKFLTGGAESAPCFHESDDLM